jgi:hypothetical protein
MAGIQAEATPPGVRVAAIGMLWDRGWGKAPVTHSGENGEGAIKVVIRHIIEGRDAPKVIDAKPVPIVAPKDE